MAGKRIRIGKLDTAGGIAYEQDALSAPPRLHQSNRIISDLDAVLPQSVHDTLDILS